MLLEEGEAPAGEDDDVVDEGMVLDGWGENDEAGENAPMRISASISPIRTAGTRRLGSLTSSTQ